MKETDYISPTKLRHFKMIEEYLLMMSMPYAEQKTVLQTLQGKYSEYYKTFDSMKQTVARLKKQYPERFKTKNQLA